jgi:hypothetical protein
VVAHSQKPRTAHRAETSLVDGERPLPGMAYALEAAAVERESPPQDPRQRRGEGEAGASQSVVGWGGAEAVNDEG